ncbi:MAG TPA: hypothetical protein ENN09_04905 [Planctomycetes bacterium]|nr:hypothetical protein [Planctomycetota bacterium]
MNDADNTVNAGSAEAPERLSPDCERASVLVEKELAGSLTADESCELSRHIQTCPECAAYMDDARLISGAFASFRREWNEIPAPKPASRRIVQRLAPYAVGLAAGVLLTAGLLFVWGGTGSGDGSAGGAVAVVQAPAGVVGREAESRLGLTFAETGPGARGAQSVRVGGLGGAAGTRTAQAGLLVDAILPNSWAAQVGILPGDRLIEAAGIVLEPEGGRWALDYLLRRAKSGTRIELLVWREDTGVLRAVYTVPDSL